MPKSSIRSLKTLLLGTASLICIAATLLAATAEKKEPGSEYKLERVPAMTAPQSMASMEVAPGYRIELVASEPQVIDPVAISTDENGKMYVVEMRDYSEKDKDFLGRIRLLTDKDGDGKYETSKVFLDKLSWPTAVICYDGGVFIGDPPDIIYAKDTDGDGVADVKQVIYTGFSRKNVQGMMNTLLWGLDHRIYGTSSSTGGMIKRVALGTLDEVVHGTSKIAKGDESKAIDFHNRDFAIDPKTLDMSPLTGGGQHGMTFDRWGDRFVCSNSDHLQAIVFEERYLSRNPYQSVVSARRSIASDGPQAEVYRISPIEAWRIARTQMRVSGVAPGPIEGGGRAGGYFTGATGVTVYEGGQWPTNGDTIVLTADVGSNLIHRKRLVPDGVTYRGDRIDKNTEFVRAKDIWFRPVQMALGADGSLLICDMYRETIEHPESLPKVLKRQLDLSSGNRGRIYRVVPTDFHYAEPKWLGKASPAELVEALDDPNQWRRMTALRLIYERQQPETAELLRTRLATCKRPESRIDMLYALDSLNALHETDVLHALGDSDPQVRRHGLRLSEPMLDKSAAVRERAVSLTSDTDPIVQFQLALSLGETRDASATKAIAYILIHDSKNRDITDAALTSIVDRAGGVLKLLLAEGKWSASPAAEPILTAIVSQIVRQRHDEDLKILVDTLGSANSKQHSAGTIAVLKALSRLPATLFSGNQPQVVKLQELRASAAKSLVNEARQVLEQKGAASDDRVSAVEDLSLDKFENQREVLEQLLSPQEVAGIHEAVLATLGQYDSPGVAALILAHYGQLSPSERLKATEVLLRRSPWALAFAQSLAKGNVSITTLDPSHVARLQNYPSAKVREIVRKLKGQGVAKDRQKVFQEYKDGGVLAGGGDPAQGKLVFEKNCATCHEIGGVGHAVGPNLAAMINRGAESVLFNVLAPNAEVDPRFMEYVVATADGQVISGVVAGETPTAVTLRGPENKTVTVLRVDIEDIHSTGKSLMPEGLEKVVDKKAMVNLISFLQQAAASQGTAK
jgi:putative membrane-bound dehydrogenase-like protein